MPKFEVIDHTADIGIAAYGQNLKEAFANAAYGMFSLIADLDRVGEGISREIAVEAEDEESLLVEWLNELLYIFDVDNIIFKRFEIIDLSKRGLKARVYGERVDPVRHTLKTAIKAATYHMLRIDEQNGYRVQVILDI